MSRGPGVQQRSILKALETAPEDGGVWITEPDATDSDNSAARRAAYRLEELGKIKIVVLDRRLVAVRPDSRFECRIIVGLDGKRYRAEH